MKRAHGRPEDGRSHPLLAEATPETLRRLTIYAGLLEKWRRAVNLIGPADFDDLWVRHFADSLQTSNAAPAARRWVDLGSGAGFPGLVTAIRYADDPAAEIHLIESDQRKCAFLRTVSRETGARAEIHCGRIEAILPDLRLCVDAVSARALAPLPVLIKYAANLLDAGAVGVFSKGENAAAELTDSAAAGSYEISTLPSRTRSSACLVLVRRRGAGPAA